MIEHAELSRLINRHSAHEGRNSTAIAGLHLAKACKAGFAVPRLYEPCLCIIAQGQKQILSDQTVYTYSPAHYLLVSVNLPLAGRVTQATRDRPYYGLQIRLDSQKIREFLPFSAIKNHAALPNRHIKAVATGLMPDKLLDAIMRLVRLLDSPQDIAPLAPLILSEIYYRLLQGEHSACLAQLFGGTSRTGQIAKVTNYIKNSLNKPIKVEDLARLANMSPSSFYNHFRQVTAMSPLQYHKRLRLTEARRLMLNNTIKAAAAAYQVGYESASQFNRDYSRLFGAPPGQDIARMKTDI